MMNIKIVQSFKDVETTEEHNGYTYSVGGALSIVVLGSLCGLRNVIQIHQWAKNPKVKKFLWDNFEIFAVPSYNWLLNLLKIIKPESLNEHFILWTTTTILPNSLEGMTVSFDGKTICSTGAMSEYDKALHILSAHIAELGITIGQKTVSDKSNEIPAMRELLKLIDLKGCMVVADALHCQTETAKEIINAGGDYLLSVKSNHKTLEKDIEDFVQDPELRVEMDTKTTFEKNGGRIERRTAYTTDDIDWLDGKDKWENVQSIGAINRRFSKNDGTTTNEWHYYISSRKLTAEELLTFSRNEWSVESMHWLLDVHFFEDNCRVRDSNVQQNINIARKIALNCIRNYKNETGSRLAFSTLMFSCLLDFEMILTILNNPV